MDTPSRPIEPLATPRSSGPAVAAAALADTTICTPRFLRLLLVQHVFGLSFSVYFLVPKYLATEFAADASTIGSAAATPLVTGVLVSPMIGAALDRYGRRSLLVLGALITLIASLGMAMIDSVGIALYGVRALQGVGFALVFNATAAMVADHAPASRLGQAMGLLGAASLVANAIGPGIAEPVAAQRGFSSVFLGAALLAAATVALAWRLEPSEQPSAETVPTVGKNVIRLCCVAAVIGAAFGTLTIFTQPLALERGAERIAGFFFGYAAGALLVRVGLGPVVDRIGRLRIARGALLLYGAVTMGTAFLRPNLLELFGFIFGIAHGLIFPALAALVVAASDPSRRGRTLTAFHASFNGGTGLSLLGCGLLARTTGYPIVFAGVGALVLLSITTLRDPLR